MLEQVLLKVLWDDLNDVPNSAKIVSLPKFLLGRRVLELKTKE
jgi:hypothetical protein